MNVLDISLPNIKTQDSIIKIIENFVQEKKCSYIDAIIEYCRINDADVTHIGELIKKNEKVKNKIKSEAKVLRLLK